MDFDSSITFKVLLKLESCGIFTVIDFEWISSFLIELGVLWMAIVFLRLVMLSAYQWHDITFCLETYIITMLRGSAL